jgi:hypothetical protein
MTVTSNCVLSFLTVAVQEKTVPCFWCTPDGQLTRGRFPRWARLLASIARSTFSVSRMMGAAAESLDFALADGVGAWIPF